MREEIVCRICYNLLNDVDYHLKVNRQIVNWIGRQIDRWIDRQVGQINGQIDRKVGQVDGMKL